MTDEFNCLSPYSDTDESECSELRYMGTEGHKMERQSKPPALCGVANR